MRRAAASFAVLLFASACGSTTVSGSPLKSCHATSDCASGQACLFSVYESCGMTGVCIATPDASACVTQTACGCNGATQTVCLVNGSSPSPISTLGSCDGATQQGFDASVPDTSVAAPGDAGTDSTAPPPDASDDSGGGGTDAASGVDANDASGPVPVNGSLGWPCTSSTQCTDPAYNECHTVASGKKICTYSVCLSDGTCQPPADGFCDVNGYCDLH